MNGNGDKPGQGMKLGAAYSVKIVITLTQDGRVSVGGFPNNLHQAIGVLDAAKNAIVNHFIDKAKGGNLDDKGNVTDERIIKPSLIVPS